MGKRYSQPQIGPARIDWSNPITKGLAFSFDAPFGQRDLVTGIPGETLGLGITNTVGGNGRQYTFSGSQANRSCSFGLRNALCGATQATWEILAYLPANPSGYLFSQWDWSQYWLVQLTSSGGVVWVAAQDVSGNRRRWDGTGLFTTAGWYHIVLSWNGGSNYVAVINGVDKTSSFNAVNTTANNIKATTPTNDYVQVNSMSGTGVAGSVVFARAWTRGLSKAECLSLSANPWQIFAAPSLGLFVSAAGGGTDHSLSAPGVSTSSPTVQSPTLAQNHTLTPNNLSSGSVVFGSAVLAQIHALVSSGVETPVVSVSAPAIAQDHAVTATSILAGVPVFAAPGLVEFGPGEISADGIVTSSPIVGTPALSQDHAISAGAISAGSPVFGEISLAQQHAIMAQGVTAGLPAVASPVLTPGGAAPFTPEQLAYLLQYMQENLMVPTTADIAAAVLAALQSATIPVNVQAVNGRVITGSGVPGDSMRPV